MTVRDLIARLMRVGHDDGFDLPVDADGDEASLSKAPITSVWVVETPAGRRVVLAVD